MKKQKFYQDISNLLENARKQAKTAVNTAMVYTCYEIGRRIVGEEQQGENRAAFFPFCLKNANHTTPYRKVTDGRPYGAGCGDFT